VRVAVVDIGTNSTRLLIADVDEGRIVERDRRTHVTRLGAGVDASGALAPDAVERVLAVVDEYHQAIRSERCDVATAVLTSAVRDAANGVEFADEVARRYGLEARTIDGDTEAALTFLGATAERDPQDRTPVLVIDIGGGSTEFVVGRAGQRPSFHVSTQTGVVRQTERHLHDDPPAPEQTSALRREVRGIVEESVPAAVRESVTRGIAVAGTATQLAAVDLGLAKRDRGRVHGHVMELESVQGMLDRLASVPLEERRRTRGLDPDRAPTIVAGAAILVEAMESFGLDAVEASETDILHGAALSASTTENG
jgi:exopolyphosphatase / guanosine-5'-triphosphate,3'-diphosphate pyrophosphatase